jgi:PDZ domain
MRSSFSPRQLARHSLAMVFAACATTFIILWIFQIRYSTPRPGFTSYENSAATGGMKVGSPAALAELRPGDQIVALDGRNLENLRPFYEAIIAGRKEVVELTVEQPGSATGQRLLRLVVRGGRGAPERTMRLEDLLGFPLDYYPWVFSSWVLRSYCYALMTATRGSWPCFLGGSWRLRPCSRAIFQPSCGDSLSFTRSSCRGLRWLCSTTSSLCFPLPRRLIERFRA